tara:strand:+ start:188 stop:904 length:717 start_codon:yes stop_codon:yes gene_type:complete
MALGTALSAEVAISMTAGNHSFTFTSDGIDATNELLLADDNLVICLMDYYHDRLENEPSGGAGLMASLWYTEHGTSAYRPNLGVTHGGVTQIIYPASSGTNDDECILNTYIGASPPTWSTLRGDETTSGTTRKDVTYDVFGMYSFSGAGRGSDQIRSLRRNYFTFDLGSISESGEADSFIFTCRLDRRQPTGTPTDGSDKAILIQATALAGDTSDYGNCFVADAVAVTHNAVFFGSNF